MTNFKRLLFSVCIVLCLAVFGFVVFKLTTDIGSDHTEQKWYQEASAEITYDENDDSEDNGITELAAQNPDCIAWVRIENTKIDYPIMQNKDIPQYYLRRNFNKEYSYIGTPFLDAECDINLSNNLIVYGHNMRDGTMFANLLKYRQKQYGVNNPVIQLITLNGCHRYVVCAVAKVKADDNWYAYINNTDEKAFNKIKSEIQSKSLYLINGEMQYGDYFLTLSTCEYTQVNGRLIVIAKRSDGVC